ncbi:MAG: hypothetical protein LW875_08945 [Proteobacteria bacterium]|nr:hypothetical protein [Pseudomonadota bacterium]
MKQNLFWITLIALVLSGCADPMSVQDLSSGNDPFETPTTTVPGSPGTTLPPPVGDFFEQVATSQALIVQPKMFPQPELTKNRNRGNNVAQDRCQPELESKNRFADFIAFFAAENLKSQKAQLADLANFFALPTSQSQFVDNSLWSHRMCEVSVSTLTRTIGSQRVPGASTIAKANQWVSEHNTLRTRVLQNQPGAVLDLQRHWSKFFMCLSFVESLTTADTNTSQNVADRYGPSGYRKPAGVKFYEDPGQPAESRLNIGLFQFTPDAGGNIFPCIRQWNNFYPQCRISEDASQNELVRIIGSDLQAFNSFCASNKVVQLFSVQLNTTNANNTHPENRQIDGTLKPAAERCVSLHFRPGNSYNHFGPFQNSTGSNLDELLTCALSK